MSNSKHFSSKSIEYNNNMQIELDDLSQLFGTPQMAKTQNYSIKFTNCIILNTYYI